MSEYKESHGKVNLLYIRTSADVFSGSVLALAGYAPAFILYFQLFSHSYSSRLLWQHNFPLLPHSKLFQSLQTYFYLAKASGFTLIHLSPSRGTPELPFPTNPINEENLFYILLIFVTRLFCFYIFPFLFMVIYDREQLK